MSNNSKGRSIGFGLASVVSFAWAKTKQGATEAKAFSKEVAAGAKEGWNPTLQAKAETKDEPKIVEVPKVGTVKYSQADLDAIQVKVAKGEKLNPFQQLVLKAQLHKA